MFLYDLETAAGKSLYEKLTGCIRRDILEGKLVAGARLPSKRTAAAALGVSVVTVTAAYEQLLAEGYLVSRERRGYYVAKVEQWELHPTPVARPAPPPALAPVETAEVAREPRFDLVENRIPAELFPLSVWERLTGRVWREQGQALLRRTEGQGLPSLRAAIRDSLYESRGIRTEPERILISAGNEQLYTLLLTLLGRERVYGVEEPGYPLIARLYRENGARVCPLPLDESGVIPSELYELGVQVLHISPSHHFPTGTVTPIGRRQELLSWLEGSPDRYIIEDDYDSEFRMAGRPIPSLQSMDRTGRVIYINTFTKTVAPSLRMGYAVLPEGLCAVYRERMGFLSCPVAVPEQAVLAAFIADGSFTRHINRTRTRTRRVRDELIRALAASPCASRYRVSAADGGLHFLLHVDTELSDERLCRALSDVGVRVRSLRDYFDRPPNTDTHTLVVGYAGLPDGAAAELVQRLDAVGMGRESARGCEGTRPADPAIPFSPKTIHFPPH